MWQRLPEVGRDLVVKDTALAAEDTALAAGDSQA